ncbi:MAG: DUF4382 domain-containing protein [Paludibacteraceae bacterium]
MRKLFFLILLVPALFIACTNNNGSDISTSNSREVSLFLTDGPGDHTDFGQNLAFKNPMLRFSAVNLDIVGVQYQILDTTRHREISENEGDTKESAFENNHQGMQKPEGFQKDTTTWQSLDFVPQTITVSMLSNGDSILLSHLAIPANAVIAKVKFKLGKNSSVVLADSNKTVKPLLIPDKSDSTLVIHLNQRPPKGKYNVMFDFDIARSIFVNKAGNCILRPTMRGFVMECTGAVGGFIIPKNIKTKVFIISGTDTISTVSDVMRGNMFKIIGLNEGTYTVNFMPLDTIKKVTITKDITISKTKRVVFLDRVQVLK